MRSSESATPASEPNAALGMPEDPTPSAPAPAPDAKPTPTAAAEPKRNAFFDPDPSEISGEDPAPTEATDDAPGTTTPAPPAAIGEGKDADLDGFLGMEQSTADGIVAALRAQQFDAAPAPAAKPEEQFTAADVEAIIEDLAMGEKAAAAFRKLAKANPTAAAAMGDKAAPAAPTTPAANPVLRAAANAATQKFTAKLEQMGALTKVRLTPGMGDAILGTADRLATAMGAKTEADFEKALNLAYYAIDPEGVQAHFAKQGQDKVTTALKRRKGMIDATQARTTSPRADGEISTSDLLKVYRSGGSVRKALGV